MNEEIQMVLTTLLTYLESAANFAAAEAPMVLQEILRWALVLNVGTALIAACWMWGGLYMAHRAMSAHRQRKAATESRYHVGTTDGEDFMICIGFAIAGVAFIPFVVSLFTACKVLAAPRVYLIGYVADLVK